jgi:hypothetical protein
MKKTVIYIIVIILLVGCIKVDDYCPIPDGVTGFWDIPSNNDPNNGVGVQLTYEVSIDLTNTLFAFSVPSVFKTPRNDDRAIAISRTNSFEYELKDPSNPPASVEIFAYAFNDCGDGEKVYTTITFDTIP